MTKYQGSPVHQREAASEQNRPRTLPAPPPSATYQPIPTVRTPAAPVDPAESGLHRAVYEWPPEESTDPSLEPLGRDTVPSPPPEGSEDTADIERAADESGND